MSFYAQMFPMVAQPPVDFISGSFQYFGAYALTIIVLVAVIRYFYKENQALKRDLKAVYEDDQELFGKNIEVAARQEGTNQELRKAIDRFSDKLDAVILKMASHD